MKADNLLDQKKSQAHAGRFTTIAGPVETTKNFGDLIRSYTDAIVPL